MVEDFKVDPALSNELGDVGTREEAFYQARKVELEASYMGKHVALYGGKVIAIADSCDDLQAQIMTLQDELGTFRAYMVEVGASPKYVRFPKRLRVRSLH